MPPACGGAANCGCGGAANCRFRMGKLGANFERGSVIKNQKDKYLFLTFFDMKLECVSVFLIQRYYKDEK